VGTGPGLTDAIQDYLKEIYKLHSETGKVTTTALAKRLRISPASVTAMVKKLAALDLVEHVPYHGVDLTPAGERVALEVLRHHRLLELYLARTLGVAVESVHAEADRLEHVLSEELETRIDRALGYPTHDPHGEPIPDAKLELGEEQELRPLSELDTGEQAVVRRVPDDDKLLPQLSGLGLVPGRRVEVRKRRPLTVAIDGTDQVLPPRLAEAVQVG
jgi:DtxR family transcriptional regulator, Mn-dependent transcriptional regulator